MTTTTEATGTEEMTFAEAVRAALTEAMEADERVFVLGEDIGIYGGAFGVTSGMLDKFGAERIRDTPIAEEAIVGAAVGAALCGMRPVAEIQFSDFTAHAMDQLVNQAAKIYFMLGGARGRAVGQAQDHGHADRAIRDPNPVVFMEHKVLYRSQSGPVPTGEHVVPLGVAAVPREGDDLTIVATGIEVSRSLAAAEELAAEGIEATVVDPRTLKPLDEATILERVKATGRVLLVQEAPRTAGFMAEIAARIAESDALYHLEAPISRLSGLDAPIPYSADLEKASVPQVPDIVRAARELVEAG